MNAGNATPRSIPTVTGRKSDPSKLVSLVALAAGAAAMPQTGNADIIYTPENTHVGWGSGDSVEFWLNLPNAIGVGFARTYSTFAQTTNTPFPSAWVKTHAVLFGRSIGAQAYVQSSNGFAVPRQNGDPFYGSYLSNGVATVAKGSIFTSHGFTTKTGQRPGVSYSDKYLAFRFNDNGWKYGWVHVAVTAGLNPSVFIDGYAYQPSGQQLKMGDMPIPEPSPIGILTVGALTLGAKGVRCWRRNRAASRPS